MGGLITALEWAKEVGLRGAFLLGCDMPLIDASLINRILAFRGDRKAALVPASNGPLGMEPLCAAYGMECLGPARELTRSGPRSMMALLNTVDFDVLPMEELGEPEEVSMVFTNVNAVEDGKKVEAVLEARREGAVTPGFPGPGTP
jgi:molybdopterin-guanine dinucleotide biosynthesis protein A